MTIKKTDPIQTVLTIVTGMLVIHVISAFKAPLYVAIAVGVGSLLSSKVLFAIDWAWMKLAWILSLFVPNILLSCVYLLFLSPLAFLFRMFAKKDPLMLSNPVDSTFVVSEKGMDKSSFEKPW